jgi:type IV pilus assembly protein PilB
MMKDIWMSTKQAKDLKLYEWVGCEKCNNSWYLWRLWIYEIISLNENLRNMIREGFWVDEIIKEARNWDLITMKEDGILKAIRGYTTIEEILRVI